MEVAYLGLFQKVFEWVLSNIFDPVYRFVSNLLTTVFNWIFQEILAPILMPILQDALTFFFELWKQLVSTQFYLMFSGLLKLIDYLQTAFDVFIGLEDVTYTEANGTVITGSLVEVLLQQKTVSTVFWVITLGALGLALMLTIFATAKSAFDLDFENRRPVSKVLAAMMKTFIQFFTVPFFVYFLLKLSAVILKGVTAVLSSTGDTTLGRIVFMIASLDAAKNGAYNISTASSNIVLGTSSQDIVRYPFYSTAVEGMKDYADMGAVTECFNLASFDFLIGFIAAFFLLFTIGICLIIFVQRIFELILLYIVSPYFVCMIPLDDGEKFSRWREMFVAKCFTGFGSAIGMRIFLMICPMVMGNRIRFGVGTSPEMDYMMKLFFLAGGAWAVYKSGSMITSLLSYQAGMSESTTAATVGGMIYANTAGALIGKGKQAIASIGRGGKHASGGGAGGIGGASGGAGGGSRFADTPADPVKQKYTGVSGYVTRHAMGSQFVNKRVNKGLAMGQNVMAKASKYGQRTAKIAGGVSTVSGWMSGKNKAPEARNRFQRAAFKVHTESAGLKTAAEDKVRYFNAMGRRLEDVQAASQSRWGLLSLTAGGDGPEEAGRFTGGQQMDSLHLAEKPMPAISKAEGTVDGEKVKYSDISTRVNSQLNLRHTVSGGTGGNDNGNRPGFRHTVSGSGGGAYTGQNKTGAGAGGSDGGNIRHTVSGGPGGAYTSGSKTGSGGVNVRHTVSGGSGGGSYTGSGSGGGNAGGGSGSGGVNVRHTVSGGSGGGTYTGSGSGGGSHTGGGNAGRVNVRHSVSGGSSGGNAGGGTGSGAYTSGSGTGSGSGGTGQTTTGSGNGDGQKIHVQIDRRNPK